MKQEKDIIEHIEKEAPRPTEYERTLLWASIAPHVGMPMSVSAPIISPYFQYRRYAAVCMVFLLLATTGGTAYASDAARPGDRLFVIDRAIEDMRLFASRESGRQMLLERFSAERLLELRSILDEETIVEQPRSTIENLQALVVSSSSELFIEADVFSDITVIKVEYAGTKSYFETGVRTFDEVVTYLTTLLPSVSREEIMGALSFETEDRVSREKDRGIVSLRTGGDKRVDSAVSEIASFVQKTATRDENRASFLDIVEKEIGEVKKVRREKGGIRINSESGRVRVRVEDNGDSRFELRDGARRVRIEEKGGEVRIKTDDTLLEEDEDESIDRDDEGEDRDRKEERLGDDRSGRNNEDEQEDDSRDRDEDEDRSGRDDSDRDEDDNRSGKGRGGRR
jgi:hypothetical protein